MISLTAPAKLTLSLKVTGLRDDGMHLLDAEMVSISLADELVVSDGPRSVTLKGLIEGVVADERNTVMRAMKLADVDAAVTVDKRIPTQAGLGGGSADAAAILRWADFSDLALAATLGADIPFCIAGGRARVTGIGDVLEPLPFERRSFTLLTPSFGCSTREVYKAWDELGGPTGGNGNDLEPAALQRYPEMEAARQKLADITGLEPRLAGSGSTWFVEGTFEHPELINCETVEA